jgi:hypothetical protein
LLKCEWPKTNVGGSDLGLVEKIIAFNSEVWKKKKDSSISLRNPIEGIEIPEELKDFEADLKACHKI